MMKGRRGPLNHHFIGLSTFPQDTFYIAVSQVGIDSNLGQLPSIPILGWYTNAPLCKFHEPPLSIVPKAFIQTLEPWLSQLADIIV
jgi:hypothetical protein